MSPAVVAEDAPQVPAQLLREKVERIEAAFLELPQVEIRTTHRFVGGMYVREITIPAGTFATGALHLRDHVSIMVRGRMLVLTEDGMQEISGYNLWTPRAGIKRIGYCHEETVWVTVDRTDAITVEAAEAELFGEDAPRLLSRRQEALECPH